MKITKSYLKELIKEELQNLEEETAADIAGQITFYKNKYPNISDNDIRKYIAFLNKKSAMGNNPSAEAKASLKAELSALATVFQQEQSVLMPR